LRFASFLIASTLGSIVLLAGPLRATGLHNDLSSFFSWPDSARVFTVRQAEIDLGTDKASLLTGAFTTRPGPRYEVRLDVQFPVVRSRDAIDYGVGDMLVHGAARVIGDSLNASGLFLRADLRIPSGSKGLRPFSNGAVECEAGLEARRSERGFVVRGAVLYTVASDRQDDGYFTNDAHAVAAASVELPVPRLVSVGASVFVIGYDNADIRSMFLLSLRRALSEQLVLEFAGSLEAGDESARAFDSCISISFACRLPVSRPTPNPESSQP
jgi:hypothetical protein